MKLIDKDAVLAIIDGRIKILQKNPHENHKTICHLDSVKHSVNSLGVEEVNLKAEIDRVWDNTSDNFSEDGWKEFEDIAKHFFELGVNTSNPLTWKDIANINDIVSEIIKECDNNILYDTKEDFCKEVLKRFKAQKGE